MTTRNATTLSIHTFARPLYTLALGSLLTVPLCAQQQSGSAAPDPQSAPARAQLAPPTKEGFWGRVNPFARKKWVNQRVDPLRDRVNELDEISFRNAAEIKDVDARAQAGIAKAQSAADAAAEQARAAGMSADQANGTALAATQRTDQLGQTVGGIDQYKSARELQIVFRGQSTALSAEAQRQLDELAASLKGRKGYLVEIEGHGRGAGSLGLQSSAKLNESVKRYLVASGQLPVYRLHAVALGQSKAEKGGRPEPSSVQLHVLENSLAAR